MDLELEYVTYMLKVSPENAKEIPLQVNNSIIELEYHVKTFKAAHDEQVKKIKEYVVWGNKEMSLTLAACNAYLEKVKEQVYSVMSLYSKIKFKLRIPEYKVNIGRK